MPLDVFPLLTGFERTGGTPPVRPTPAAWIWFAPSPIGIVPPSRLGLPERWARVTYDDALTPFGIPPKDRIVPGGIYGIEEEQRLRSLYVDIVKLPTDELRRTIEFGQRRIAGLIFSDPSHTHTLALLKAELARRVGPDPGAVVQLKFGYEQSGGILIDLERVNRPSPYYTSRPGQQRYLRLLELDSLIANPPPHTSREQVQEWRNSRDAILADINAATTFTDAPSGSYMPDQIHATNAVGQAAEAVAEGIAAELVTERVDP